MTPDPTTSADWPQHAASALRRLTGLTVEFHAGIGSATTAGESDGHLQVDGHRFEVEMQRAETVLARPQLPGRLAAGARLLLCERVTAAQAGRLRAAGVRYLDAAGNAWLHDGKLFVLIEGREPVTSIRSRMPRLLRPAGLKLLFLLLREPAAVAATYRELAARSGISLGAVGQVMQDLRAAGHLLSEQGRARLVRRRTLLERWVPAYQESLRPRLVLGDYTPLAAGTDWQAFTPAPGVDYWGGDAAADRLTHYLASRAPSLYTRETLPSRLALRQRWRAARPEDARAGLVIRVLRAFWPLEADDPRHPGLVPPLLVYADLLGNGDDRSREAAARVYDAYLAVDLDAP